MPNSDELIAQSHLQLEQRIRERAHQIWLSHPNGQGDTALSDWLEAEREVLGGRSEIEAQNRGATVGPAGGPDLSRIEELGEA